MKYIAIAITLALLLLASFMYFNSSDEEKAYYEALNNFTYVDDIEDEYIAYERIDKPFYGDCEDFAFTLQKKIGGEVWAFTHNNDELHAALVLNGIVYDSLKTNTVALEDYSKKPLYKITFTGEVTAN